LIFIFSGFIKPNDPIGFSYKLTEYYSIFGTAFMQHQEVLQAVLICVAEIVLGICVLIGIRMRVTSWLLLGMIIFFTFLTGFTAVGNWFFENPDDSRTLWWANLLGFVPREIYYMKDCGCFGDAIKLTPWQSFYKDLFLTALILIIFIRRKHIRPFFAKIMQTNLILIFTAASASFSVYCWMYMPVINYLYWDEGANILELTREIPETKEFEFIYKHNTTGEEIRVKTEDLANVSSDYSYHDRIDVITDPGVPAKIHDFFIKNAQGEDLTESILSEPGYSIFVIAYDLSEVRLKSVKKFKEVITPWQDAGRKIHAFTNSDPQEFEQFRHEHQLPFSFYQLDRTALKSVIRSNPGYILMHEGIVVKRWSSRNAPSMQDLEKAIEKFEKKAGK
ncbi:MAG: DoxX family protein, partial [Bacteroidota bacterium]|nr:DoxX family protein [Bacteroidota bacterium]MDX5431023.1 DoxX family protein [Bacteroidota bacterium]MDX5469774.1 DoxX family protein [Bacteroidota bacterium]